MMIFAIFPVVAKVLYKQRVGGLGGSVTIRLDKGAFISAARVEGPSVAFLVGAPLAEDSAGGVAGVSAMLALIKEEVQRSRPHLVAAYEIEIAGKTGGAAYQAAMGWLQGYLRQDAVNRVVKSAVLRARKPGAAATFAEDGVPADWYIPSGIRQLAQLVSSQRQQFPGPILTTNFDPLIGLAIREAGGLERLHIIDSQGGGFPRSAEIRSDTTNVVHLHGYWRGADTMHTPSQLTGARAALNAALQRLLRQHTLVVAAYGGWEDAVAQALVDFLADSEAQSDVLWCFHESNPTLIEANYKALLERVRPAILGGRFQMYGGIDCHSIFAEIGASSAKVVSGTSPARPRTSPLVGWEIIDSEYLSSLPPLTNEETIRYFDGAIPTWRHAISDSIPRRIIVQDIVHQIDLLRLQGGDGFLQVIRAAGGEGKSTLLLQVAVDAARTGNWSVISRSSHLYGLTAEHVVTLDPSKHWLIVADDAENLVGQVRECAVALHTSGRSNVNFLLAARDADWRAAGGDHMNFGSLLRLQEPVVLRGITFSDAKALVAAWAKRGPKVLGTLSKLYDPDRQATAFVNATKEANRERRDGSLFGGLLAVRFDELGLRAHVREFLARLREMNIPGSNFTLFDALVDVAAIHAVGIQGIDENVLADLISVPRHWINTRVVRSLGEEAAGVHSAGHVFTRHTKVAAAILVEAEEAFAVDLAEVWSAVVQRTIRAGKELQMDRQWYSQIIHAGPLIYRNLPKQFTAVRRKEISITAVEARIKAEPNRLSALVDLGRTYRLSGDLERAIAVFRDNLGDLPSKVDFFTSVRGYWHEWAVCEGARGTSRENTLADAWLDSVSLSDYVKAAPIDKTRAKLSLAGIGVAFGKLTDIGPDGPFARAQRAASYLGRLTDPDPKAAGYFNKYARDADKKGTSSPVSVDEAIDWLTDATVAAGREIKETFLKTAVRPEQVSFDLLRRFFGG